MNPSPIFRKFVIILATMVCIFYLFYRLFYTFNLETSYAIFASVFLYVAEVFGIMNLLLFFFQVWEVSEPNPMPVLEGRTVDVFVPTYNEDIQLLRATLEACVRMDYPHRTFVLDDGRRPEVKALADELGVYYLTRNDNRNAKAGNLNNAFEQTDGEFIVLLDADHVPEPHFITRLIGYFADPKIGFVQTPHAFYNFDSFQARLDNRTKRYWEEGHQFYCVIQPGRNHWNAPIFAGSAAMFRRSALRDVSYIAVETITEDLHTGMRIAAKNWKSVAITERLVAGQAAPDITTFHSQRLRWGEGNLSIMAYDNPIFMRGLTLPQRFCYFASMIHWAGGLFKLAIYLSPLLMLFTGVAPVNKLTIPLAVVTGTYLLVSLTALKVVSNGYGSIINSELFSMINFWTQIKATFRAIFKRRNQRFVVTRKRGRQSKQIWPFIRPQIFLILCSILALFWGWGRLILQISDDWFKPIIPSLWALFHIYLAYLVTRRAFWPVNRRFSTRHEVNLPVEYDVTAGNVIRTRFGLTADLNETGMAMIAYEKLDLGTVIRLTIRGANEIVKCKGEIRSITPISREKGFPGFRCGIQFLNLTSPQVDALNRICLHYAVPRLYEKYNEGNRRSLISQFDNWRNRGMTQRRREARYGYHLPIILNTGTTEETLQYTSSEDLSRVATAVIIDQELQPGTIVSYLMPTPLGDVRGMGKIVRSERRRYAGQVYHRASLEFTDFEGQGRTIVQSLANPDQTNLIQPVLSPVKTSPNVRMGFPIMIAAGILLCLIAGLRFLVFQYIHEDDLFLRAKIEQSAPLSEEDRTRIDRILKETNFADGSTGNKKFVSSDRLVLLMKILSRRDVERAVALDRVTTELSQRDPTNLNLRAATGQSLTNLKEYAKAEVVYDSVLTLLEKRYEKGDASRENLKEQYIAAARSQAHYAQSDKGTTANFQKAADYFKKALDLDPMDAKVRYYYAGMLAKTGTPTNLSLAESVLSQQIEGTNEEYQELLIRILVARKEYDRAIQTTRKLSEIPQFATHAKYLQGIIFQAKENYTQANAIFEELLKQNPNDQDLIIKLAQCNLADKNYEQAMLRFQYLLDQKNFDDQVVKGYIDAAASVKVFPLKQENTISSLYEHFLNNSFPDHTYLIRFAWVEQRVGELKRSKEILTGVVNRVPKEELSEVRRQIAGLLIQMKDYEGALSFLENQESVEAKRLRALIFMNEKKYPQAIQIIKEIIEKDREDIQNHELLADLYCMNTDFDAALAHLNSIQLASAEDRMRIKIKKAKVLLWSGSKSSNNFQLAAAEFQKIIDLDFVGHKNLWNDFVDAASAASSLDEDQVTLAKKIATERAKGTSTDVLHLSRLSWVLIRSKAYSYAKPLLDQAMKLDPKEESICREMAGVMSSAERFRDAIKLMSNVKTQDVPTLFTQAQLYSAIRDFKVAEQFIDRILKDHPDDRKAKTYKADLASWKTDYVESNKLFAQLAKDYPNDPIYPIRIAENTLWNKEFNTALSEFETLYNKNPNLPKVWEGFANAAAQAYKLSPAQEKIAFQIANQVNELVDGSDPVIFASCAWMMSRLQKNDLSDTLFDKSIKLKTDDPIARRELARIYYELRRFKEGLALFDNVILGREDRFRRIDFGVQLKDAKLVSEDAKVLLAETPNDPRALSAKAYSLSLDAKHEEALKIYQNLLKEQPNNSVLYRQVCDALLASGYYPEALDRYQKLLVGRIDNPELWFRFIDGASMAPKISNDTQRRLLLEIYNRIIRSDVQDAARFSRLSWAFLKNMNDAVKANILIDRAVQLNPSIPDTRVEIAGVLAGLNRFSDALNMFSGLDLARLNISHRRLYIDLLIAVKPQQLARAEAELRLLLQDQKVQRFQIELRKLLASVLMWEQKYQESRTMWETLEIETKDDPDVLRNLAYVILWSKENDDLALDRFSTFLDKYPEDTKAWTGYVEAVTRVKASKIDDQVRRRVQSIYNKAMVAPIKSDDDVINLASLGAALGKLNDKAKSRATFARALNSAPQSKVIWTRFAETLYMMGDYNEANRIFTDLLNQVTPTIPR